MGLYRYSISLRITHPNMTPEEISGSLGMIADTSWRAGDPAVTKGGKSLNRSRRETYWTSNVSSAVSSDKDLSSALHHILDRLTSHEGFFRKIRADGGRIEFFIGWFLKEQAGVKFDQSLLSRLTALQIDFALDTYHDPDIPDEDD
jgi:hypothetical protein